MSRGNDRLSRADGVTLVELMIALAIGSILIVGALSVYVQSRKHYTVNEAVAQLQNNARYALELLEPDLRLANFYGLTNQSTFIAGVADEAVAVPAGLEVDDDCGQNWSINLDVPVQASNDVYDLGCPAHADGAPPDGARPNTDVLVVRHASVNSTAAEAGSLQIQSSPLLGRLFADGVPSGGLGPTSQINDLVMHAYYVAEDSVGMPGVPALRRKVLRGATPPNNPFVQDEEVVPGVEDFQVQLGIDTNGDDAVNQYVDGDTALPAGARVMAVRIWLLVRAARPEVGFVDNRPYAYAGRAPVTFNDGFRRLLISRTIQLRNMRQIT